MVQGSDSAFQTEKTRSFSAFVSKMARLGPLRRGPAGWASGENAFGSRFFGVGGPAKVLGLGSAPQNVGLARVFGFRGRPGAFGAPAARSGGGAARPPAAAGAGLGGGKTRAGPLPGFAAKMGAWIAVGRPPRAPGRVCPSRWAGGGVGGPWAATGAALAGGGRRMGPPRHCGRPGRVFNPFGRAGGA